MTEMKNRLKYKLHTRKSLTDLIQIVAKTNRQIGIDRQADQHRNNVDIWSNYE